MAATSLALAALAGTALLAVIEAIAHRFASPPTRGPALITVAAIGVAGGAALVVAAVATVELAPSAALLAAAATCVAALGALVLSLASSAGTARGGDRR